ncbi:MULTISPECIES: tyrosine-protein phosphatase [Nocardia]|uniref:Protein-tyrosine-phosphatase n=1 Tax=Nocardia arthritidis TaxID=228602 RepID=A0A6G9YQ25_9NOCA|nr:MULTISPECIES: tyrosine-protein phosphatase [Nocardia]QIS15314.1 protein-tyrosine-phosphatase [Nocardia arthritidis]
MTLSPPADQFYLSGTFNFRDTGGLRTVDGARVRSGVLLRSAQLTGLDHRGHAALRELRVSDVHDLRGISEIEYHGADNLPDEVRLHVTPFDPRMGKEPPHEAQTESALAHMHQVYRMFPLMAEANAAIVTLAESLVRGDGAVLVHCAAGKDRTGWSVATILRAVGVSEADILADFLLSNAAVPSLRAMLTPKLSAGEQLSEDILGVREEYLAIATASAMDAHGHIDTYLEAIGLTVEVREHLKNRLLE